MSDAAITAVQEEQMLEEDRKVHADNLRADHIRHKKRKTRVVTQADREAKARELDSLLDQSETFSKILINQTRVLGRVGTALDGTSLGARAHELGEHDLVMAEQPKCMVGGKMWDYQLEGLTWMYEIVSQGMSGILADEMGLGKTIQTISLIAKLREVDYYGPHLIVAPLSTLSNWMDEFHKWTPSVPVVLYHGLPPTRKALYKNEIKPHLKAGRPTKNFPVVCTSYEMVIRDASDLSKINWEFIIVDEGHRLKNASSRLFAELKRFSSASRLLITGTPLQNNLKELWALLHFLLPNIFADWDAFESWFDFSALQDEQGTEDFIADETNRQLVAKMHVVLQPLLLRRIKADVAQHLPKKREYVLYAPMTKEQTDLYNIISKPGNAANARAYLVEKVAGQLKDIFQKSAPERDSQSSKGCKNPAKKGMKSLTHPPDEEEPSRAPVAAGKNAFALMMGKSKVEKMAAQSKPAPKTKLVTQLFKKAEPESGAKNSRKRKEPQDSSGTSTPSSKSVRSSRQSTPGGTRTRRGRTNYREAGSDEDDLSDDEFEKKLAREIVERDEVEEEALDPEELERLQTLDLAKREMSFKKMGNMLVQLRLACNSPHLFFNPWLRLTAGDEAESDIPVDESIVTSSGKMLLLDRLLQALFAKGHRVLIFSQFKMQLDLLELYCAELRGWATCRIDGGTKQEDRKRLIRDFNADPEGRIYKVFLLSTRAGGLGINLASADTVVLFDSDWNPQLDLQAQDRAHRIGQTKPVIVYRLATKGTVEDALLMSADAKRRLEKLVIKKGGFRTMGQKMTNGEKKTGSSSAKEDDERGDGGGEEGDPDEGGEDGKDDLDKLDKELLRSLLLKDGQVYESSADKQDVLSDRDVERLCDRSDEAYARAAKGEGDADGFKVVETKAGGLMPAAQAS